MFWEAFLRCLVWISCPIQFHQCRSSPATTASATKEGRQAYKSKSAAAARPDAGGHVLESASGEGLVTFFTFSAALQDPAAVHRARGRTGAGICQEGNVEPRRFREKRTGIRRRSLVIVWMRRFSPESLVPLSSGTPRARRTQPPPGSHSVIGRAPWRP